MIAFAGFKELDDDFKLLSNAEKRQVSRKAVRAGAVVFRDAVRANAPVRSGLLKRSVSVDTVRGSATAGVKFKKVLVKKKGKKGRHKSMPFYWYFLEHGTSNMPAKPFVRPAFDASVKQAEEAAFNQYLNDIDRIFSK
ncbi:HK97-gp10 family putative phage morphogenesis protein [Gilliamella apicola]|nr:HK97-gp10 family putative phage morphogenesis protein [Gilliamella apicola]